MLNRAFVLLVLVAGATSPAAAPQPSPHSRFILANGARLYVADWGGTGPLLLFLPGFGNGAHIFDGLAPAFTDRFHVAALTPRGFPPSSAPDSGYTIAQLAADVRVVLDSLGADRAVLAGHSISGAVITRFAIDYPGRLIAAVYLDGAYDFGESYRRSRKPRAIREPPATADTLSTAFRAWRQRYPDWDAIREQDSHMWDIDSAEIARRQALVTPLADEVRSTPHEVWRVRAPALVVCPIGSMERSFGWLTRDSTRWQTAQQVAREFGAEKRAVCEKAAHQLPRGHLLVLEGGHYVFLDQREAVVREMRRFLAGAVQGTP